MTRAITIMLIFGISNVNFIYLNKIFYISAVSKITTTHKKIVNSLVLRRIIFIPEKYEFTFTVSNEFLIYNKQNAFSNIYKHILGNSTQLKMCFLYVRQ